MQCPHPFHSLSLPPPSPSFSFTPVVSVALLPFHDLSLRARHRSPFLPFTRAPCCYCTFLSRSHSSFTVVLFSGPFLSFILDPPTIPRPLMESRHSRTVSPFGIVTFSAEMETVPKWKLFPAPTRETELPRNPLIYSVITGHRPSSL